MLKDTHLIEAANCNDRIVASLDEAARRLFNGLAAAGNQELRSIVWVNPERSEETATDWLDHGASDEAERRLGFSEN